MSLAQPTATDPSGDVSGLAIDIHTHYVPRGWPDLAAATGRTGDHPWLSIESERDAIIMLGSKEFRRIESDCWDAERRLGDMDADGIDAQAVSPTPVFFTYAREPAEAAKVCRIFNDLALDICAPAPHRLLPFAQVPLQDTESACIEVDRCKVNGHVGVEIGNHVGDRDLDDDGIVTFLQHCASIDMPVFVHPWDLPSSPRLDRWMGQWLTGMPAETHLSIIALILGGGFDRLPRGLRIAFAHGGGSFAFWLGRVENAWHRRPDVIATSEHPPSHYLDRFSVDSAVFTEPALRLLIDTLGADRVMLGSDYPYPLGERPSGALIRSASSLTESVRSALLGRNAQAFLGPAAVDRLRP
ncbi:MAG: amidohydrolase family protein [Actinobacteria bacterium]|uniref:2-amino-3-carboxymuconate-6-semialdehyde decarboxylase n=1 Tax=freshwater metagenome TaxID=449393 RepID=A0A6J7EVQ7_9ZZZZ|nr:amidohydrolase family protein [Actinomycetota bacterium]